MPSYTVTVATGSQWFAGTDDYVYITLVGTDKESEKTLLDKPLYDDFERGAVSLNFLVIIGDGNAPVTCHALGQECICTLSIYLTFLSKTTSESVLRGFEPKLRF